MTSFAHLILELVFCRDLALDAASQVVPECSLGEGTLTGTVITGVIDNTLAVTGNIESNGEISGGFAFEGGAKFADYNGNVVGANLEGTWKSITGCTGTWQATKI